MPVPQPRIRAGPWQREPPGRRVRRVEEGKPPVDGGVQVTALLTVRDDEGDGKPLDICASLNKLCGGPAQFVVGDRLHRLRADGQRIVRPAQRFRQG